MGHGLKIGGELRYEIWTPDNRLIHADPWAPNGVITATIDALFDVYFSNGSPPAAWYLGLIANSDFTSLSSTDTMSSHSGWTEATNYSGSRPAWGPGSSSSGVKTNANAVEYTISTEGALRGMFVTTSNTKGGTTGTLWATGEFSTGSTTPPAGATFKLFYRLVGREG